MKFEEIQEEWAKDEPKVGGNIAQDAVRCSYLHGKYYKIWRAEKRLYNQMEADYKLLKFNKIEY